MTTIRKKPVNHPSAPVVARASTEKLRPWLLLGLSALLVARPLLPSEGVAWLGDGQPLVVAWIVLGGLYFLWATIQGRLARPLDFVDASVGALLLLVTVSAFLGLAAGTTRYALNMFGEWVALILVFFLARQMLFTHREARAAIAVMLALTVVIAAFGLYQAFVTLPADRAAYLENPEAVLGTIGQPDAVGSPDRMRFESRLMSTEPLSTFALTNSLAGFLTAWLVMFVGIGWHALMHGALKSPSARLRLVGLAVCMATIAFCLLLTKSRSAYVAVLAGLALVPFCEFTRRRAASLKLVGIGAAALVAIVTIAALTGGLDLSVLTEAKKSLGYRLEYWHSTLTMIGTFPWLGVGTGNFQDYYTMFKLPQASEEIRDPHNFLLEVWATSGTFAALALMTTLVVVGYRTFRFKPSVEPTHNDVAGEPANTPWFLAAGGAAGFFVAFVAGPPFGWSLSEPQLGAGLLLGGGVLWLLWPWVQTGSLPQRLPALAALALAIHLSASGGITFPGVAGSFWLLLAVALNQYEPEVNLAVPWPNKTKARAWCCAGLVMCSLIGTLCYQLGCLPAIRMQMAMALVDDVRRADPNSRALGVLLLDAANSDIRSADPWLRMAELELAHLEQFPQLPANRSLADQTCGMMIALRPHSSYTHQLTAHWYRLISEREKDESAGERALKAAHYATVLYPNSAQVHAEYALLLAQMQKWVTARRQAEYALRLNEQTPHADKKLPAELVQQMAALIASDGKL